MNVKQSGRKYVGLVLWVGFIMAFAGCNKLEDPTVPSHPPITTTVEGPVVWENQPTTTTTTTVRPTGVNSVFDPLTTGRSDYEAANGGIFSADGFTVTTDFGEYLAYSTSVSSAIRVEFDAWGYDPNENGQKSIVVQIFDSSHEESWLGGSSAWATYNFYEIKKVDDRIRLKAGGRDSYIAEYVGSFDWDFYTTYHWVITIADGTTEITRDGELIASMSIPDFQPSGDLNIRIGGSWCDAGSANVTYSNVVITGM